MNLVHSSVQNMGSLGFALNAFQLQSITMQLHYLEHYYNYVIVMGLKLQL